ncbi:putative ABC transport system ATP-binding protein [Micromonospora sp. Llam0]|uniref:ABC transporter ATP-binding protein n=1 Tax=Micromonospora sp. Llam0 TaxID=2485143 RepID=UPI000F48AD0F|nr:ABC transporter ATP-binding protein [Micromonospora sp. Llam0]ROO60281.1 putative ABC transport system ATP-binding protein [Micromonospora sp. Llam0]
MSGPVLRLTDVERVYQAGEVSVRALAGVSLSVRPGELVAVMGPSGSGKSTLLAVAGGLDTPTAGSVEVEGVQLGGLDPTAVAHLRRDRIGYVFQDYNLVTDLTAAENVALPLELAGAGVRSARSAAVAALDEVGLAAEADRFPDQLSGGQQQRVAIARALVGGRRLVLADEPTGALDSQTSVAVLKVLRARIDAGAAGVLVTHEARYAGWADRTIFVRDGRLVDATPERDDPRRLLGESS